MPKRIKEVPKFINKNIVEITGLNPKTIDFYTKTGVVLPSIFAGMGKGTARIYSAEDVLKFMLIPVLSDNGLSLEKIKKVFDLVKVELFKPSNPHLYHGLPNTRAILSVYDYERDDFTAQVVFPPDPEVIADPKVKTKMEENLKSFTVDMLSHKSILMVDITQTVRKMKEVENLV